MGSLRRSRPARLLKKSPFAATAKNAAHTLVGQRDFLRGYRFGRSLPPVVDAPVVEDPENPLRAYFDALREGPGIWKWRHYFDIYHRHLAKFRDGPVNVVEVGIYSGGSLEMWRQYFGGECHIYGVDIEPTCRAYESDDVTVFIGDQADAEFWAQFVKDVPSIDVVIDDGGHRPYQQIATLKALLPRMNPGGVFICEDVDGPMQPFLSFVDGLTRHVSGDALWAPATPARQQIASMHRYPMVTVIEKPGGRVPDFVTEHHGSDWLPFLTEDAAVHRR